MLIDDIANCIDNIKLTNLLMMMNLLVIGKLTNLD